MYGVDVVIMSAIVQLPAAVRITVKSHNWPEGCRSATLVSVMGGSPSGVMGGSGLSVTKQGRFQHHGATSASWLKQAEAVVGPRVVDAE